MTTNRQVIPENGQLSAKAAEQKTTLDKNISFTLSTKVTVFSLLPKDMMNLIFYFLNREDSLNFLRSSKNLFVSFRPTMWQEADQSLKKLLSHGALGELNAAEILWKKHPSLLTFYGTVYHPNRSYIDDNGNLLSLPIDIPFTQNPGRYKYINCTFYKILLMNSEFKEAEKVGKMMTQEEKQKQFIEVFPDGEIRKYNFDLEEAKKILQAVFTAVEEDKGLKIEYDKKNIKNILMSDSTRKALYKLYAYAKPTSEHKIGLVFCPEFYHEALKLYDDKFGLFEKKWDKNTFWNICVEEWLAGCLGTRYLREHSQGKWLPDEVGCVFPNGTSYFAFRRGAGSLPGYHFYVRSSGSQVTGYKRSGPLAHFRSVTHQSAADFQSTFSREQAHAKTLRSQMQILEYYPI